MRRAAVLLVIGLLGAATAWAANPSPPKATTGSAGGVGTTAATLTGTVDSGNADSAYHFQYGTSSAYGLTTPVKTAPAATTPQTVTETVTGLTPTTGYHYRLTATNAAGASNGDDKTFTTPGRAGQAERRDRRGRGRDGDGRDGQRDRQPARAGDHVHLPVRHDDAPTACRRRRRASARARRRSPVKQALAGLKSSTTYHYRVSATNAQGTVTGSDRSFKTKAGAVKPGLAVSPATKVTGTSAQLNGKVDPNGVATTFVFQYGTSKSYGAQTPVQNAGAGPNTVNVSAPVGGLQAHTTYHFRIVATSANGTFNSGDRSFYTATGKLAITFGARPDPVVFGHGVALFGRVNGAGGGVPVVIHGQAFPFSGPMTQIGNPVLTDNNGNFKAVIAVALVRARYFATASVGGVNLTSPAITSRVRVRVGLTITKLGGHLVRFHGTVMPASTAARVSIQRRARHGNRWIHVARANVLAPLHPGSACASPSASICARGGVFRAVVIPNDGAHTRNFSRSPGPVPPLASRPDARAAKAFPQTRSQPVRRPHQRLRSCGRAMTQVRRPDHGDHRQQQRRRPHLVGGRAGRGERGARPGDVDRLEGEPHDGEHVHDRPDASEPQPSGGLPGAAQRARSARPRRRAGTRRRSRRCRT